MEDNLVIKNYKMKTVNEMWEIACQAQMKEVYSHIVPNENTNAAAIKFWTKTPPISNDFEESILKLRRALIKISDSDCILTADEMRDVAKISLT